MRRVLFPLFLALLAPMAGCSGGDSQVDMSKTVTDTNAPPVNLTAEVANAKSENKLLLLEFGSSDSCPPCVLVQQKVFSTPEFMAFAKTNLNFVRVDFPLKVDLRPDTVATNELLQQQFNADGFPTFVALDKNGKEFWRMEGVTNDSLFQVSNFINLLKEVKKQEQ
ncbi:MAG TPA: thioredoxin fold domain-containing protein [Verrucomicrobiae bacterium]|nr:thioredoxin fold domain-containing protein [Verrucomicrobiae bacterium]